MTQRQVARELPSRRRAQDGGLRNRRGKTGSQALAADHDERAHDDKEGNGRVAKSTSTRGDGQSGEGPDPKWQQ